MTIARVVQAVTDATTGDAILDDEASAEASEPREVIDVVLPTITYRIATGARDIIVNSVLYTAISGARGEIGVSAVGNAKEMELVLPIDHALARRYTQQGIPPRKIEVTLWRYQVRSAQYERIWVGNITSMGAEDREGGRVAKFRVPSRAGEAMLRQVPSVGIGRTCPHVLYDSMCKVDRNAFKITTTVISVDGRTVRVDMGMSHGVDWAENGEFLHVASGERMTIGTQTDINPGVSTVADLEMQMPIVGMEAGDAVEIYAGCKWTIEMCHAKFDNRQRFGGCPQLPSENPFLQLGFLTGDI